MRLFVAVWPPEEVLDAVAALPRPDHPQVRWTNRNQWHVTLRFLGEVDEPPRDLLEPLVAMTAPHVTIGPTTERLSGRVLMVPVHGLDELAAAVAVPDDRPVRGHLTLARARQRGAKIPASLAGAPIDGSWMARRVALVRSHLGGGPARYEDIESVDLAEGA
jgi:RNA 2',3'-cyclic 3'-phosphodiesterase